MTMDLVLGLSMTSQAVRWVLVEGTTGEGATIDRGAFDLAAEVDPDELVDVLLLDEAEHRIHAIGVTWTNEAEDAASGVLAALAARQYDNVIAVSEVEAADVLAAGIASLADYDDVAVCIVEPDAAVVAVVGPGGVDVDRIARPRDKTDVVELPSSVLAMLELDDRQPDAIFVVGSDDDLEVIVSTLEGATESAVFSAADANLALARGAALAGARAVNGLDPSRGRRIPFRIGALTAVLTAAVVTFVVSLSVAAGLGFTRDAAPEQPQAEPEQAAEAPAPPTPPAVKAAKLRASLEQARPLVAQTLIVAAPPAPLAPEAPAIEPPAYAPPAPAPAYPPPPPPAYVAPPAPVPPVPQPRLRDRIIERIPIINRFHEPEYQYPR